MILEDLFVTADKDVQDQSTELNRLVEVWHEYGEKYNVFVPKEQPSPRVWDKPFVSTAKSGKFDPQMVKHWRFFEATRNFLKKRYQEHGILTGASRTFDCLVPKFHKPLQISPEKRKKFKIPKGQDPSRWYADALEILITAQGEVGFVCKSVECQRTRCKLHRSHPKRRIVDIYSVIQIFEGHDSPARVVPIIEAELGPMVRLPRGGTEEKSTIPRIAVPKTEIHALIGRHSKMRRQHVPQLIREAETLISSSEIIQVSGTRTFSDEHAYFWPQIIDDHLLSLINSPAIRLYLWLLVYQEERARENEFQVRLTDAGVARSLDISRKTAGQYRQILETTGLLKVEGGVWTVGYRPNSQGNT